MGKNIAIIVLLGLIGFFGYYGFKPKDPVAGGDVQSEPVRRVKQKVPVVLYSNDNCPYCVMAKDFMDKKGIQYEVRDVRVGKNGEEMSHRTGGLRSIPQIFINHKHIGGWSELQNLDFRGALDDMLTGMGVQ